VDPITPPRCEAVGDRLNILNPRADRNVRP
jgi:hypothetical protein